MCVAGRARAELVVVVEDSLLRVFEALGVIPREGGEGRGGRGGERG